MKKELKQMIEEANKAVNEKIKSRDEKFTDFIQYLEDDIGEDLSEEIVGAFDYLVDYDRDYGRDKGKRNLSTDVKYEFIGSFSTQGNDIDVGDGQEMIMVVKLNDVYIGRTGYYSSYDSTEFDGDWKVVEQKEKTVKYWK